MTKPIDPAFVSAELEDSARQRAQAKSDQVDANELIQRGQQMLADASRRFIAHDAVIQALTTILQKGEAPNAPLAIVPDPDA